MRQRTQRCRAPRRRSAAALLTGGAQARALTTKIVEADPRLTDRQERILGALCREYIISGRPVASSSLSRAHGLRWSSATIRSELAALEFAGYLSQPHQSAGRLPTARGLGRYIRSLPVPSAPSPALRRAVDLALAESVSGPQDMRAATRVLSELAGCVTFTFVGGARRGVMRQLDVVPMPGAFAMVVLGLDDGSVSSHPVSLDTRVVDVGAAAAARGLCDRLRALCIGKTLAEARADLREAMAAEEARFDRLLGESLRIGLWLCTVAGHDPLWFQVAGQRILAAQASLGGLDALAHILGLLEDYHQVAAVLCQLLPAPEHETPRAEVRMGIELSTALVGRGDADALGLSLVGCRLRSSGQGGERTGAVALLGPDRMDYEAVIPLVEYAAQALASRTST